VVAKEAIMEVPPATPAEPTPAAATSDAYLRFWDCVESDAPVEDDSLSEAGTTPRASAYDRFWETADV
jgi:hypothetical protein